MIDDLKSCSVCGTRLASKWSKGDLVHYCAYCAVAECSDNALALRETGTLRARAEAAEQRAEALAAELAQARADARVLLAECYSADVADGGDFFGSAGMLAQAGMTRSEMAQVRMLPVSGDDPAGLLAVIQRVLGGAA